MLHYLAHIFTPSNTVNAQCKAKWNKGTAIHEARNVVTRIIESLGMQKIDVNNVWQLVCQAAGCIGLICHILPPSKSLCFFLSSSIICSSTRRMLCKSLKPCKPMFTLVQIHFASQLVFSLCTLFLQV